jgi:hypothetical protein
VGGLVLGIVDGIKWGIAQGTVLGIGFGIEWGIVEGIE